MSRFTDPIAVISSGEIERLEEESRKEEEEGNDLGSEIFFGGARRAGRPIGVAVSAY